MKDGSLRYWVTSPLNRPIRAAITSPTTSPRASGKPWLVLRVTITIGTRAKVIPAERSMSPHTSRNTSPAAMMAAADVKWRCSRCSSW